MTRSDATAAHQAAHRGNKLAMKWLIDAGADLFATTASGWLPIHNALKIQSPAYRSDPGFAAWLCNQMRHPPVAHQV